MRKIEKIPISFSKDTVEPPPYFETEIALIGSVDGGNFSGHSFRRTDEITWSSGILNLVMDSGYFDMKKQYCMLVGGGLVPSNENRSYYVEFSRGDREDIWELVTNGNEPLTLPIGN